MEQKFGGEFNSDKKSLKDLEKMREKELYETQTLKDTDSDAGLIVENLKGFDLQAELENLEGPSIEIAGPTAKGYVFNVASKDGGVEAIDLFQKAGEKGKVYISNIFTGIPHFIGEKVELRGAVDFVSDAQNMPIRDSEAGVVFCSCLGQIDFEGIESM